MHRSEFLTDSWFATARALFASVGPTGAEATFAFAVEHLTWHLVVGRDEFVRFGVGAPPDADILLQWKDVDTARRIVLRELRGDAAMRATTVHASDDDGCMYVGPPAPANLMSRPEIEVIPRIPGATFTVQYRHPDGPFGSVSYALAFVDGRPENGLFGETTDADIEVEVPYVSMARVRAGEMTIIEALEDGRVDGPIGPLAALAGILESPEFRRAEVATGRQAFALGILGRLDTDVQYAAAIAELAAATAT